MGFFKRLFGKQGDDAAASPGRSERPDALKALAGVRPRSQYYFFQHYALRQAMFQLKVAGVGVLLSPRRDELLRAVCNDVTKACREKGETALDPYPGVEALPLRAGKFPCVVLTMPPPLRTTECHFVGVVAHFDPNSGEKPSEQTPISYFTLERGVSLERGGAERTVLCEWNEAGTHLNMGDGPPPDAQAFADSIAALMEKRAAHER
jgi:hypothetical protein